jgi:hypothetical protein
MQVIAEEFRREKVMIGKRKFVISAIHYNEEQTFIEKVKAHEIHDDGLLSGPSVIDRPLLIGLLQGGNRIYTMENKPTDEWKLGKDVHRVYDEENLFLSTDPMETHGDNLGKLQEF